MKKFECTSENKRILRKNDHIKTEVADLPLKDYTWHIGKMGADFYAKKFGSGIMSANKLRELFTDPSRSNMNCVFKYFSPDASAPAGYALGFKTPQILHYSYPFCALDIEKNLGMAMMLKAIIWAHERELRYIYLGTLQKYKLQFRGVEYFNGKEWSQKIDAPHLP